MAVDLSLDGLRALVVEDEYFLAEDLKMILKRNGAVFVRLSGTIDDALRQARSNTFDFGLFDLNLQGQVTFLVADDFAHRHIPFAFVSGYGQAIVPPRFAAVPNWGKPYDERAIVGGIQVLWRRATMA